MEPHRVFRVELIDGQPPIDLAWWRREPSVTMRVPGKGNAGGEITTAGRAAHSRDVEISLFQITSQILEDQLQMAFGFRMMNERGLQLPEQIGIALDLHAVLGVPRVEIAERVFDHRPCKVDKVENTPARGEHKKLAVIKLLTSLV